MKENKKNDRELTEDQLQNLVQTLSDIFFDVKVVDCDADEIAAKVSEEYPSTQSMDLVGDNIVFTTATYAKVDGQPKVIEALCQLDPEMVGETFANGRMLDTIEKFRQKVYGDGTTKAKNRYYYDTHLKDSTCQGVALIDVDHYDEMIEKFGEKTANKILRTASLVMLGNVRAYDTVVRFGRNEFLLAFMDIPEGVFYRKMDDIKTGVNDLFFEECPDFEVTVSIGAVYHDEKVSDLLKYAEMELEKSKKVTNKISYYFFDSPEEEE